MLQKEGFVLQSSGLACCYSTVGVVVRVGRDRLVYLE